MTHTENWIWLPNDKYKNEQTTVYSGLSHNEATAYAVAEFIKKYSFDKKITRADLRFSGDAVFQLFCNNEIVATGPVCAGGDFIGNETPRDNFYASQKTIYPNSDTLEFFARVQLMPYIICEFSKGHGGFMLSAILTFEDGSSKAVSTGDDWLVRKNSAYTKPRFFDGRIKADEYVYAEVIPNIWNTIIAPIPVRFEEPIITDKSVITLEPYEEKVVKIEFDKIWGGCINVKAKASGEVYVTVGCRELSGSPAVEEMVFAGDQEYRSFAAHSAGNMEINVKNTSCDKATITVVFIKTHYPVFDEANIITNDLKLNQVLDTCKHTLKICRQTHHLDSTHHCEPLACTGDYYIESMMTLFSFGDMRLAEFDLVRTAIMLERENGRMFHTTYSLIWVRMLCDVYMITGNVDLLRGCERALSLLLTRFESYLGENGLIETPPDYMFVDWIYIDDLSMHHPPKALGQSCMNMFYFGAMESASYIFGVLGNKKYADELYAKKEALRDAINTLLFDKEKGCYFEGLNTPTDEGLIGTWMPKNVEKRYYLKHSNILAAFFGVCDDATGRRLVDGIMSDEIQGDCQPYFMHYLFEAIYRLGMRDKYTLELCNRWKPAVEECSKGLVEGFVTPEPSYSFDHSHAWGGTPLYSLPKALLGLEIIKPGMSEIAVSPSLLGLENASVEMLTPYGKVVCTMNNGEKVQITHPENVSVLVKL